MPKPSHKMKALVVNDSEEVREILSGLLKKRGIQVLVAGNAGSAIDHLMDESFDFVVTDLDAPGTNGLELIRWLRPRQPFLPVVIVPGNMSRGGESAVGLSGIHGVREAIESEDMDTALPTILQRFSV